MKVENKKSSDHYNRERAMQEYAEKCKKAEMNAYLSQSVQVEQVIKTVEKALQIR